MSHSPFSHLTSQPSEAFVLLVGGVPAWPVSRQAGDLGPSPSSPKLDAPQPGPSAPWLGGSFCPPPPHPEAVQLSEAQSLSGEGGRVALQLTGRHAAWGLSRAAWWPESWLGAGLAPAEESLLALDGA